MMSQTSEPEKKTSDVDKNNLSSSIEKISKIITNLKNITAFIFVVVSALAYVVYEYPRQYVVGIIDERIGKNKIEDLNQNIKNLSSDVSAITREIDSQKERLHNMHKLYENYKNDVDMARDSIAKLVTLNNEVDVVEKIGAVFNFTDSSSDSCCSKEFGFYAEQGQKIIIHIKHELYSMNTPIQVYISGNDISKDSHNIRRLENHSDDYTKIHLDISCALPRLPPVYQPTAGSQPNYYMIKLGIPNSGPALEKGATIRLAGYILIKKRPLNDEDKCL